MTPEIALVLIIISTAVVLFSLERIPADVIALGVMLTLILANILTVDQAFAGFGSQTVLLILGLLIITASLVRTGVVDLFGRAIFRITGDKPDRIYRVITLAVTTLSSFMSNTAATAFFLPMTIGIARRAKLDPAKILLPLAFGSILASSVTLIATSTNIVVSGLLTRYNLEPLGVFELTPVGLPIAIAGWLYMYFIGRKLIPTRDTDHSGDRSLLSHRIYLAEVVILDGSPLAGKTLSESSLGRDLDLTVISVVRNKSMSLTPHADLRLEAGDVLIVKGERDEILKIKTTAGIDMKADVKFGTPELTTEDVGLVEVILMPRSPLIGRTLAGRRFRDNYGVNVLAINHNGEQVLTKISTFRFHMGDVLLIQGDRNRIEVMAQDEVFSILQEVNQKPPNTKRANLAVLIFVGVLAASVFEVLPLAVAVLLGALIAFLSRCITPEEAYRAVEWKALILIGCMLALGVAMEETGTAAYLASQIANIVGGGSPIALLGGFFLLTMLLTQPMSNQAAAVVVFPVAVQTALQLGFDPRPFAIMIAVAASCSFITPLEPSCLLVYGPGRYKFFDFVKVGTPLTLIIFIIAIILVPLIWSPVL